VFALKFKTYSCKGSLCHHRMLPARVRLELGLGAVFSSGSGLLNIGTALEMAAFCPRARLNIGTN